MIKFIGKGKIFKRILLLVILTSITAGLLVMGINLYQESNLVRDSLIEENKLVAKLAARAIETGSLTRLWPFELLEHISGSEDILFWWVVESDGRIKLADDVSMQNKIINEPSLSATEMIVKDSIFYKTGEQMKLIIEPINIGTFDKPMLFYLGISLKRLYSLNKIVISNSIYWSLLLILLSILPSIYLSKIITISLNYLMDGVMHISKGDLNYQIKVTDKDDEFGHLAGAFNDMTRKLKENKERDELINQMKSDFVSIAAHQLRTPLTGIKWVMEALLNGDAGELSSNQKEILKKGYESNERVIKLSSDLLNVARIGDGQEGFTFKIYNFEEILNDVIDSLKDLKTSKNIVLNVSKPDSSIPVKIDKDKIELALFNVLDNALKYTPNNGVIDINIKQEKKKNLKISIKDNGIGIPIKEQGRLYSKFFRGSNVVRMQAEGTGLGLFIVKNIIERHKGKMEITSKEGAGTEVLISLPINIMPHLKKIINSQ